MAGPTGKGWYDVTDFADSGGKAQSIADGSTLATSAIQAAIDTAAASGGGTAYVPPGRYLTGAIVLRDNVTLHLEGGAVLLGSPDPAHYPATASRWEGIEQSTHAPLVGGSGLRNIALVGRGTIDGQGQPWWARHRDKTLQLPRPRLISFHDCSNVLIEGLTLVNSPSWTVNPICCDNVTISKLSICNPADSPNTDGINPESCSNVHISNCHVDVGDDCVTIKSGTESIPPGRRRACQNITITNCTMVHGHGGVVIGSEMSGDVRNVTISNCVFVGTDRGIRIKSRRGRGGIVEDIRVSNVVMDEVLCPFIMNLYYYCGPGGKDDRVRDKNPLPVDDSTPRFRRVHLSHITARNVHYAAAFIYGLAEMPVEDLTLDDVVVSMKSGAQAGKPAMMADFQPVAQAGIFCWNARDIRLTNVRIDNQIGAALDLRDARGIVVDHLRASPPATGPAVTMAGCRDVRIDGSVAVGS